MSERSFRRSAHVAWTDCSRSRSRCSTAASTTIQASPGIGRTLQRALSGTQARRPPSPAPAQRRHDAPSARHLAGQAACDLIVMDDATSEIYSAFLVEEEGIRSVHLPGAEAGVHRQGDAAASTPTVAATTSTPPRQAARSPRINTPRSAAPSISSASTLPIRPRPAAAPSAPSSRTASSRNWRWRGSRRSKPPTASSQIPARPQSPLRHPARARRQRLRAPRPPRPGRRHPLPAHRAHSRPRQHRALRKARPPDPRHPSQTSRPGSGSTSIQTEPSPSSTGPDASPATPPTASPSKPQPGRPRETLRRDRPAPCGQVDSRSAPDHFPTGQTATTEADI